MASILKLEWCGGILQAWLGEDLPRLRLTQKEEPAYGACPSPKEDFLHEGNSPIHLPSPWNTPFYRRDSCPFLGDELLNACPLGNAR
jgi:hypothetical protein